MRRLFALLSFVVASLALSGPALADVERRGFLYSVTADDGRSLFLYGTMHLGRAGSEPLNGPVRAALANARRLALEADPSDAAGAQALALRLGHYAADDGLDRHVTPALLARVRSFGARNGLEPERLQRVKPWLLANMVVLTEIAGTGLDAALGSEMVLAAHARARSMPIVEIEGLEAQLSMLAGLPDAVQTAQLEEALTEADSLETQSDGRALFELWRTGDRAAGDALVDAMHREAGGKVFERYFVDELLDRRNRSMAEAAERLLREPGATFFAVGALHLFGEAGLLREFERRGHRIVDLQSESRRSR